MVPEDYVHRIGRTGRAGRDGQAVSLVCVDEAQLLRDIERLLRRPIPPEVVAGFEPDPRSAPSRSCAAASVAPGRASDPDSDPSARPAMPVRRRRSERSLARVALGRTPRVGRSLRRMPARRSRTAAAGTRPDRTAVVMPPRGDSKAVARQAVIPRSRASGSASARTRAVDPPRAGPVNHGGQRSNHGRASEPRTAPERRAGGDAGGAPRPNRRRVGSTARRGSRRARRMSVGRWSAADRRA